MTYSIKNVQDIANKYTVPAVNGNVSNSGNNNGGSAPKGKPAKYWFNFGAFSVHPETGEQVFGSIGGMPLDTASAKFLKSGLVAQAQMSAFKDLMEIASELQPGQSVVLEAGAWAFELRHVRDEGTQATDGSPALVVDEARKAAKAEALARVKAMRVAS